MYVCQLSFLVCKQLSDLMDLGSEWERLAALMGVGLKEVMAMRGAQASGQSPTQLLLRVYGSRGHTVDSLFLHILTMDNRTALDLLSPHVSPEVLRQRQSVYRSSENGEEANSSRPQSLNLVQAAHQPDRVGTSASPCAHRVSPGSFAAQSSRAGTSVVTSQPPASSAAAACPKHENVQRQPSSATQDSAASSASEMVQILKSSVAISYDDLCKATDNFSPATVIGRGGYGVVHKGTWKFTTIAVKRILPAKNSENDAGGQKSRDRLRQSLVELKMLAVYRHENILPLYGYSLDGPQPCLVYQFMRNGSLDDRLRCKNQTAPLNWAQRLDIAANSARGLNFLHTCAASPLIHGDIKSANILLDEWLQPRIGDFGLARRGAMELPGDAPALVASHLKGTLAYLPPEFVRNKLLSTKLDIYSFGVVLLEIAMGERAYSTHRPTQQFLADYVRKLAAEKLPISHDTSVEPTGSEVAPKMIALGLTCSQIEATERPSAESVCSQLIALSIADTA